jgi:hypothetical protein
MAGAQMIRGYWEKRAGSKKAANHPSINSELGKLLGSGREQLRVVYYGRLHARLKEVKVRTNEN